MSPGTLAFHPKTENCDLLYHTVIVAELVLGSDLGPTYYASLRLTVRSLEQTGAIAFSVGERHVLADARDFYWFTQHFATSFGDILRCRLDVVDRNDY